MVADYAVDRGISICSRWGVSRGYAGSDNAECDGHVIDYIHRGLPDLGADMGQSRFVDIASYLHGGPWSNAGCAISGITEIHWCAVKSTISGHWPLAGIGHVRCFKGAKKCGSGLSFSAWRYALCWALQIAFMRSRPERQDHIPVITSHY